MNNTKITKISNLPKSIPKDNSHFAESGSDEKFPAGPTIFPSPGPTLVIAVQKLEEDQTADLIKTTIELGGKHGTMADHILITIMILTVWLLTAQAIFTLLMDQNI